MNGIVDVDDEHFLSRSEDSVRVDDAHHFHCPGREDRIPYGTKVLHVSIEIKDYVVLQKPQEQANRLTPSRTQILDFTMTHIRFERSILNPIGQLTSEVQTVFSVENFHFFLLPFHTVKIWYRPTFSWSKTHTVETTSSLKTNPGPCKPANHRTPWLSQTVLVRELTRSEGGLLSRAS